MGHRLASHTRSHIMRFFVALSALVAVGLAADEPVYLSSLYAGAYHGVAPVAHAAYAPYYAPGSQFHAQDEFGNLNYGYANINSHKQEVGNTYGGVTGGYSYVDANGVLQTVRYIADGLGFRVEDSRLPVNNDALPVAPVYDGVAPTFNPEPLVAPVYTGVAPTAPEVTPEVAAATAEHLAAHAAAKSVEKREAAVIDGHTSVSQPLSAPHLIHNAPTPKIIAAPAHVGYAGLGYAGPGHAGLGYAGLGYHGLGYAGLGHAGLGYHGIGYGLHH